MKQKLIENLFTTEELCPYCDKEVIINIKGYSKCPNCGNLIKPCSVCDREKNDCNLCPIK